MYPMLKQLNNKARPFEITDIPKPEFTYNVETKTQELEENWLKELKEKEPKFIRALWKTFQREIIFAVTFLLIDNATKLFYSIYVADIVKIISSPELTESRTADLLHSAAMLSLLVVTSLFAKNWSLFAIHTNLARARLAITCLLYRKLHLTSLTSLHEIKLGKVINLIGNDLNDMATMVTIPFVIINPPCLILGLIMMWSYFGPATLVGFGLLILVVFGQMKSSKLTEEPRKENKKTADERVKLTHEVVEGIRLIKMYTWEKLFKEKILGCRKEEEKTFTRLVQIDALSRNLSNFSIYLNILTVCIVYTMFGGVLSPDKIYASMLILLYVGTNLVDANHGRMGIVNFKLVAGRVQEVLTVKNVVEKGVQEEATGDEPVIFKDFTGYWSKGAQKPCLSDINLICNPGHVTAIIGKIGSGKTTLLFSLMKELPVTTGTLEYSGKIAYVEQDPIIFSGTVRENILFGREFNEKLYRQVIKSCNLERDLELFTHGDGTLIGERGVNMSGGQKARVSLARALYSQSDIYLLDDPFSALDSRVSRDIFDKVLKGSLLRDKVVILVTHHLHFAKESDHVVLMNEGKVEIQGTFAELERSNNSLLNVFKIESQQKASEEIEKRQSEHEKRKKSEKIMNKGEEKATKEEAVEVSWSTYKKYIGIKGTWKKFFQLVFLFCCPHIIVVNYTRFLGTWAEDHSRFSQENPEGTFNHIYYVTICLVMLVIALCVSFIKSFKTYEFLFMTNTEIHWRMLNTLLRARTVFFDINPVGRILNRFSNDLGILDKGNPRAIFEILDSFTENMSLLFTVIIIKPVILILTGPVIYLLYRIKQMFNKPIVLTKKLDLESKSPMISAIPAALQGLTVIRVYNQGARFIQDFANLVYINTKAITFQMKTTRLFTVMLETPVQSLTVISVWIFVLGVLNKSFEAGLVGLSLMYLLKIGSHSVFLIRLLLEVDVNMQSAQRAIDYFDIKSEAPEEVQHVDSVVPKTWPSQGAITFNKVFMRYREDLGFALKGLTLQVPGGLKIACIGRTGAGKSSIIQALFRMTEIERGGNHRDSFIKIDDVDIGEIGLKLLRSRLSIIPQVPVVFTGTIKRNLDPFLQLSDYELWKVLEDVGLKQHVASLEHKLETDMTVSSSVFSTGQKQLMCLARAILSKSKVIILDEATANVDVETDNFIQKTIMEKFKDCTVLTVAHRLVTIANYDRAVVIDNGSVVEYDSPYALLVERIGDKQITRKQGLFAEMVRSTGSSMAKKIFDMTREQYEKTNGNAAERGKREGRKLLLLD